MIDITKLEKFVDKRNVALISSIDNEGFPNMKAMLPHRKREGLKTFYFTTNTSSMRVAQYRKILNAAYIITIRVSLSFKASC